MPCPPKTSASRLIAWSGFGGRPEDFDGLRNWLPGFSWSTPWLPGHGPRPAIPGQCDIPHLSRTLLEEIPPGPAPVLLGYSLGGRLAMTAAVESLAAPQSTAGRADLAGLILLSASPGLPENTPEEESLARLHRDRQWASRLRGISKAPAMADFFEEWWSQPLFASPRWTPTFYRDLIPSRLLHHPQALATVMEEASVGGQPSLWSRLPFLNLPVLLVAGGTDEKFSRWAVEMGRILPRAEVRILPDCGHSLLLENPPDLAEAVGEWWAGIASDTTDTSAAG